MTCLSKVGDASHAGQDSAVSLERLHTLMAEELLGMTRLCDSLEDALSGVLAHLDSLETAPIVDLQGIDRLRQSLADMSRLASLLSSLPLTGAPCTISAAVLKRTFVMAEIANRFTSDAAAGHKESPSRTSDEFWV